MTIFNPLRDFISFCIKAQQPGTDAEMIMNDRDKKPGRNHRYL